MATKAISKKPSKKASEPKARVVKKSAPAKPEKTKKVATKRTGIKKKSASSHKKTPKRTTKAATSKTSATAAKKTVQLPNRMPVRAQEKALVLTDTFQRSLFGPTTIISRVCGICFVVVGATASLSALYGDTPLSCGSACSAQLPATTDLLTIQAVPGTVTLLGGLPAQIASTVNVPIEALQAEDIAATLEFTDRQQGSRIIPLTVSPLGNDKYSVEIRGGALSPARYTLKTEVRFAGQERYNTFTLGSFLVSETAVNTEADSVDITSRTVTSEQVQQQVALNEQAARAAVAFSLRAPATVSKVASIQVATDARFEKIDFFMRPLQGTNSQKVGSLRDASEQFVLSTVDIPNGTYELFARGFRAGTETQRSESVSIEVFNRENIARDAANGSGQQRQLLTISRNLNEDLYADFEQTASLDESVVTLAQARLTSDETQLQALFTAYAAAQQTGDEQLILKAEEEIFEYQQSIVAAALMDENDRFIADELDMILDRSLSELRTKVDTFEKLRSDRTESDSASDTDGDGISDIDEEVLYGTDPESADTDGDGFTDGAEIVGGYDPLDVVAEVPIVYESPKETLVAVQTKEISIIDVVPDVIIETASTTEEVHTIVRGVSLPNIFLTLYVFSTPTIVTVRTEADGSFEYTFTKELEDGEHQVFAALTDNAGEIVAQSQAFTFVKEARAFTPVDAEVAQAAVSPTPTTVVTSGQESYRIAIGMSVLALGIILIMLGIGLQNTKPEIVAEE